MKSRIICLCLCLVALVVSMVMTVNLINSDETTPNVYVPSKDNESVNNDTTLESGDKEVELTDKAISSFSDKVESFVLRLAYEKDKSIADIDYIIENLDKISGSVKDSNEGKYLETLSSTFKSAKEGFTSDEDFSVKVGNILKDIDDAASKISGDKLSLYPELDTTVGGDLTLALLSIYEMGLGGSDPDTYVVTVGGGVLLGDRLGTAEADKFSTQVEKYTFPYPFHKISSVTMHDDLTLVSLEAPLTSAIESDSTNPAKGSPNYVKSLLGVEAVSLASSGVMEYGDTGFNDTVKVLRENGISYSVQEGSQGIQTDFGKVVYITFDLRDTPVTLEQKTRNEEVIKNAVKVERENGATLIIVQIHWNTRQRVSDALVSDYLGNTISEYEAHFDVYNKEIAQASIDAGADLVVGYGARVLQGIQLYKDKMIVLSTGDLSYSGGVDSTMKNTDYSFLFRQTFKKDENSVKSVSYRIIPIINTSSENPYLPEIVFDERADKVIETLVYQSRYFGNAIKDFNYIKIAK
ncbi:MAG: hypothetical protein E7582_01520 [Ruminococcaceae bacterium]|nr:hypothetical protein [Oscillospiraceae bacterium]